MSHHCERQVHAHAGMQQRARLKALDRFKSNDNAVLVASDVAARGLDVTVSPSLLSLQLSSCIVGHQGSSLETTFVVCTLYWTAVYFTDASHCIQSDTVCFVPRKYKDVMLASSCCTAVC